MLGMLSESRCSDVYALRNCSTTRCTASLSKRGGACSAQTFGAGLCKSPMLPEADPGTAMSAALVSASHLSSACCGAVLGVRDPEIGPELRRLVLYEAAEVGSANV